MKNLMLSLIVLLLIVSPIFPETADNLESAKPSSSAIKLFDVNKVTASIRDDGRFADTYKIGLYYKSGLEFNGIDFIYTSGFWLAAVVDDSIRASIAAFSTDFTTGAIGENGQHYGEDDSLLFRIYKINRGDNEITNPDYADWPIQLGAPSDGHGNPRVIGDQTLWCSFSDAYLPNRFIDQSPPLNAEIHLTVWGWNEIDNVVFLHWDIINKSDKQWNNAFIGIYCDPDVDDASDDLVGSDSTLNMVYCYESSKNEYSKKLQAVGYVLTETPVRSAPGDSAITYSGWLKDHTNIPAASPPIYKHAPREWTEYPFSPGKYTKNIVYRRLNCIDNNGNPLIDPMTGKQSRWAFSGDPVFNTGWLDDFPGDRRMMVSAGPFDVAPGDTNGVTLAIIPVQSKQRKACVYDLKQQAGAIHSVVKKSAGLFTKSVVAPVGESGIRFPIGLMNICEVQKISFVLNLLSDAIKFVELIPVGRAESFSMQTECDSLKRKIKVTLDAGNQFLPIGNDAIACAVFDSFDKAESLVVKIKIEDINFTDKNHFTSKLDDVAGMITLEKLPPPPRLITPVFNEYIDGMKVTFSWTAPIGSLPNRYILNFIDPCFRDKTLDDTTITLNTREFVFQSERPEFLNWSVNIANYVTPVYSPDTFRLQLPSPEKLNFCRPLFKINLPAVAGQRTKWIEDYAVQEPYLYMIFCMEDTTTNQKFWQLYVLQMSESSAQVVHIQPIEFSSWDRLFEINNEVAYIYLNRYLHLYAINENKQFVLQKSFPLYFGPAEMIIYKDYLVFYTLSRIIIYQVKSLTEIKKIREYNIADWQIPDPGSPQHRYQDAVVIKNDCLFLAQGDWGIFDLSNPDSLKLLCRVDIPDSATTIDYENDRIYVGSTKNWIGIYDVTTKARPKFIYGERFVEMGIGGAYNKIAMLKVFDDHIYFENWGLVGLQVCHYEPEKYLVLDGILGEYNITMTPNRIYGGRGDTYTVYENRMHTGIVVERAVSAQGFQLFQNHPNPFNPTTAIRFSLEKPARVSLKIYNILGQEILELWDNELASGVHSIQWDGKNAADQYVGSGLYFARLETKSQTKFIKMLLIR